MNTHNITTADAVGNVIEDLREMRWLIKELKRICQFEEAEMDYLIVDDVELLDETWCRVERKLNL